jgi:hypothetical protein
MKSTSTQRAALFASCALLAALVCPVVASAWQVSKSTNGVVVSREWMTDATGTVTAILYYDYKGEPVINPDSWSTTYSVGVASSYRKSCTAIAMNSTTDSVEVGLVPGFRNQLLTLTSNTAPTRGVAVLNDALEVSVIGTPNVDVVGTTVVTGTVSVSQLPTATVSTSGSVVGTVVVSTMPSVSLEASAVLNDWQYLGLSGDDGRILAVLGVTLVGGALGYRWADSRA